MPALYLFGRLTLFGGDDLQPAAFVTVLLRSFQLFCLLLPIFLHISEEAHENGGWIEYTLYDPVNDSSCRHCHYYAMLFVIYTIASSLYSLASLVLEWRIAHWSSQGSPTDREPRSARVASLLEYKLVPYSIILFLIWVTGISAVACGPRYYRCLNYASDGDDGGGDATARFLEENANPNIFIDDTNTTAATTTAYSFRKHYWWIALAIMLLTQLAEVLFSWVYLIHLCGQPKDTTIESTASGWETDNGFSLENHELMEEMWAERCSIACRWLSVVSCFLFGGRELNDHAEFSHVAAALADYLTRGILDVVPSDIAIGLVVLEQLQRQRLNEARQAVLNLSEHARLVAARSEEVLESTVDDRSDLLTARRQPQENPLVLVSSGDPRDRPVFPSSTGSQQSFYRREADGRFMCRQRSLLDRNIPSDLFTLEEGARYASYALAIYTWVLYLYVYPLTGPARLLTSGYAPCCCCFRDQQAEQPQSTPISGLETRSMLVNEHGRIEGDNLCQTHKAALLLTAGLLEADLVYAQLKNGFSQTPYCILLDHQWMSVVISIRGTFSLEDCVTDVLLQPESLEPLGIEFGFDGKGQYCHGGVLACVRNVYRDLRRHGLLDRLLLGDQALYPAYTLRLVGHSLGAATCTLLSYMLRSKFPTVRCVNYSPPCAFTWDMAVGCKEWCNSFFVDSDIVPRLSLDSMDRLRDDVLELFGRIKVPKIEVARRIFGRYRIFSGPAARDHNLDLFDMSEILYAPDEVPPSAYQQQLARFQEIQRVQREARGVIRSAKLLPPGKMIQLTKTGEKRSCIHNVAKCVTCCTTSFGSEYLPVWMDTDDLNEIVVSPTMGSDHFPNRILAVLANVAKDYGV